MKPNTRLLIRLTLSDDSVKGWGYDYPYYKTKADLIADIEKDFKSIPNNKEIRLFYYDQESVVAATDGKELSQVVIEWLLSTGNYS